MLAAKINISPHTIKLKARRFGRYIFFVHLQNDHITQAQKIIQTVSMNHFSIKFLSEIKLDVKRTSQSAFKFHITKTDAESQWLWIVTKNLKNSKYSSCVMLRKPFGVMVSSPDQTPQVPFMFFLIIHYFERPASSVRLVKSIHLRALTQYWLIHEL